MRQPLVMKMDLMSDKFFEMLGYFGILTRN